jgi:hypothetical protein
VFSRAVERFAEPHVSRRRSRDRLAILRRHVETDPLPPPATFTLDPAKMLLTRSYTAELGFLDYSKTTNK